MSVGIALEAELDPAIVAQPRRHMANDSYSSESMLRYLIM